MVAIPEMKPIYIVPGDNPLFHYLFNDLKDVHGVCLLHSLFANPVDRKWQLRIRKWLGNRIEYYFYRLFIKTGSGIGAPGIIVVSNIAVPYIPRFYLSYLQRRGYKLVLYFLDSLDNIEYTKDAIIYTKKVSFDAIYTFDKKDAQDNGYKHFYTMYSSLAKGMSTEIKYDLSFIGSNNGRYEIVRSIMEKMKSFRTYTSMYQLSDIELNEAHFQNSSSLDYKDVVQLTLHSKCILDIVSHGKQSGLSIRPYEAVVYNKKLITNNPSILEFPYYDPRYMLYIKDASDIDVSFLYGDNVVDYGYDGRFSPVHFIEMIRNGLFPHLCS